MELDVGGFEARIGLHEDAELARRHGHGSGALQRVLQADLRLAEKRGLPFVVGAGAGDAEGGADLQAVLEILAHRGPLDEDVDAMPAQELARADSRQLQELRRAGRAGRHHHGAARRGARRPAVQEKISACGAAVLDPAGMRRDHDVHHVGLARLALKLALRRRGACHRQRQAHRQAGCGQHERLHIVLPMKFAPSPGAAPTDPLQDSSIIDKPCRKSSASGCCRPSTAPMKNHRLE